ncbi:hypothetical protein K466DRAFT_236689 [Polyporus arcularius HHB13444]|uniref:DUF7918 domain-containing protein n=1 Tax=Polyporus arcularius HHB13444 TaxID=1314778 RepID=A0A5C3PRV9_9APHY|nr:hypothetical protein K466DRAFT_236689 [Polyporus arcularius HHB13444]
MRVGNCEVWLTCNGELLPEISSTSTDRASTCLVPSRAGESIVVKYRNHGRELVRFDLRMDGSPAGKRVCWPNKKGSMSGIRTGAESLQLFQFSSLVTTDDDHAPNLDDDGRVGVIHVSVIRISRRDRVRKPSAPGHHTSGFRSVGVVHERSKKAGTHCISLGHARHVEPRSAVEWKMSVDPREEPLAYFTFRYRPEVLIAVLQAEGLMPYAVVPEAGPFLDNYKSIVTHVERTELGDRPPLKSSTGEDDTKKEVIEVIDLCCDEDHECSKDQDNGIEDDHERPATKTEHDVYPVLDDGVIDLTLSD